MIRIRWDGHSEAWRVGAVSSATLGTLLLAWALAVDVPRTFGRFFSDGATYYSLGHSLAQDGDFEYRRGDLTRVWREFPSGPEGIFLKRGRTLRLLVDGDVPFVHLVVGDDPDPQRLYYGKSFIYPLAAAPFIALVGTNGFFVLHAVLLTIAFLCTYSFLSARSEPAAALMFTIAFVLVSSAPIYALWLTPDFFNFGLVTVGYFFWLYKEVASPTRPDGGVRSRWLVGVPSDFAAALLLGIATFSKPTHVLLMVPPLAFWALRGRLRHGLRTGAAYAVTVVMLFGVNTAVTGEWNYQGGDRRTFYNGQGGFPFQFDGRAFDRAGQDRTTNRVPVEILSSRDALVDVFRNNLAYFLVGRHTGFAPYYLPGVVAVLLFLLSKGSRASWQWLTLAGGVGSAVALLLYMPFTYSGGGGPVGNRYFLGVYPLFVFLVPAMARPWIGLATIGASALFVAPILANPVVSSIHPTEHTNSGLFRLLPIERTLVNDLPVNLAPERSRQPLGGSPPVSAYFIDDNAYIREGDAFWVRGESRADVLLRAPAVSVSGSGVQLERSLVISRLAVELETGPKWAHVTVRSASGVSVVHVPPNDRRTVTVELGKGLPYRPFPELPTNYIYTLSVAVDTGFTPLLDLGSRDARFLGIFVRLTPSYTFPDGQPYISREALASDATVEH